MTLARLTEADVEGYVSENQGSDRCWFFVHIPKTAGSSFRRELADILRPNYNVHIDRDARPISHAEKMVDAVQKFDQRLKQRRRCRFASGHVPIVTLSKHVEDWQDLKLITMLRDPVKRVISDYRYQTTEAHPSHREFLQRFPTFESYVEHKVSANRMFHFLRPSTDASLDDCMQFVTSRFAFVGILEMYPLSFRLITRLIGEERSPSQYVRKTIDNEYNRIEITPELIERIRKLNHLDLALYKFFHDMLSPVRQTVLA